MGRRTAPVSSSKVAVSPKTRSLDVTTRGAIPSAAVATRASVPQASQQHNQHTGPSSFPFPPPLAPAQGDEPGFVVVDGELPVARTNTTGTAVGGNGGTFRRRHSASTTSSSDSTASTASTNSGSSGSGGLAAFNVTFADLIAVPCPGADAEGTWDRAAQRLRRKNTRGRQPDEVPERVGSAPAALQSGGTGGGSDIAFASRSLPHLLEGSVGSALPPSSWITSDVRAAESGVRVLLYKHRELGPDTTLDDLAEDLLDAVVRMIDHAAAVARGGVPPSGGDGEDQGGKEEDPPRAKQPRARPIFFVCHSIGGLVFKKMLVAASQRKEAHRIIWNTHGATFFGTPHRGSSYLSMANLAGSIQTLLHLSRPLPRSIYERLRLNDRELLLLHEQFTAIASELRLWTFYEMVDSQLSGPGRARSRARETKEGGGGAGLRQEVTFSAPLVSIKSSLLGVRQEQVFAIEGDHAECASFGPGNDETRDTYLIELAAAIRKAMDLTNLYEHHPLSLKTHVRMELIGFYEDPDAGEGARPADEERRGDIRLYRTDYKLSKFLEKGPERCLEERLSKHRAAEEEEEEEDEPAAAEGQSAAQTATAASPSGGKEPSQGDTTASSRPGAFPSSGRGTLAGTAASAARASSAPAVQQATSSTSTAVADPAHQDDLVGSTLHAASSSTTAELQTTASQGSAASQHPRRSPALDSGAGGRTVSGIMKEGSALRYLAGFSRPDPNRRKFMWMHLPFNNPTWVKSVFETISRTKNQSFAHVFNHQHWYSKHVTGRHSQIQPSYVHPSCAFVPSPPTTPGTPGMTFPSCAYLYMPYLGFDRYKTMLSRRNLVRERTFRGRARPVPEHIANLKSLEFRVLWEYLQHDPPFNYRRTLDQFGYPSLRDTYSRDDDQMLYKLTKDDGTVQIPSPSSTATGAIVGGVGDAVYLPPPHVPMRTYSSRFADDEAIRDAATAAAVARVAGGGLLSGSGHNYGGDVMAFAASAAAAARRREREAARVKDGKVLMVDQLWLWAVDRDSLVTFFGKRESHPKEGPLFQQADLRNSVYNELNGDLTGRCENALDLAAFVALHAVTVLLSRSSHPDLEVFRVFEEAVSTLTDRLTLAMKRFRTQSYRELGTGGNLALDDAGASTATIRERHRLELEAAERENRENTSALLELRDLEDELTMLQRLFETQENCLVTLRRDVLRATPELAAETTNGQAYIDEALAALEMYKAQTADLLARTASTRTDYEKLLEMVQRQSQVDEVRWSRLQTELASAQNLSVMIFTVFTVIFLPLTFFTGLFGMNTQDWAGDGTDESPQRFPTLATIGSIALPASFALLVAALAAAFSARVQRALRAGLHSVRLVESAVEDGLYTSSRAVARAVRRALPRWWRAWIDSMRERRQQGWPGHGGLGRGRGNGNKNATGSDDESSSDSDSDDTESEGDEKRTWDYWAELRRQRGSVYNSVAAAAAAKAIAAREGFVLSR